MKTPLKFPLSICICTLLLFVCCLAKVDRFFFKKNGGFCIRALQGQSPYELEPPAPPSSVRQILDQPFFYLTKGHQSYVFESADGTCVLKFYRFPSHLRSYRWLKHPLSYRYDPARIKIKAYNLKKLKETFDSYHLAFQEIPQETALVWIHLSKTDQLHKQIELIDRLGHRYLVDSDTSYFIVQKKAGQLFPTLEGLLREKNIAEAKSALLSIIHLIQTRADKGIADHDAILEKNYGFLEGKAVHIDVGRLSLEPFLDATEEIRRATASLKSWLERAAPELLVFLEEALLYSYVYSKGNSCGI